MELTPEESVIHSMLLLRPDEAYVTPDGFNIYMLVEQGMIKISSLTSVKHMSDDELNKFIQEVLSKNM